MDLFGRIVDEAHWHPNFSNIMRAEKAPERVELLRWANGFPDRDGKFVREFQTTFNSSFWEIYLYALFKDYGFQFDWSTSSPDFHLSQDGMSFLVEATTANAASGKPNEWERQYSPDFLKGISFNEINREAIIRLSNCVSNKWRNFQNKYSALPHVKGKPFVLAIAPFEQPFFNLQYNRPIVALLYDYYVDEDAVRERPEEYPNGPPVRHLGCVTKDNGAEIELGLFNDDRLREVSAVIFSCTATWGKVDAMTTNPARPHIFHTVWGTEPNGKPERRVGRSGEYQEAISDGLQIYHNPYAQHPLRPELFRKSRVVQVVGDLRTRQLIWEEESSCLMYRLAFSFTQAPADEVG